MRALVTNDDGVASPGLAVLAEAARRCGLEVTVVAPRYDASGSSASMTAMAEDGQVTVADEADAAGAAALGVHGPPAFIVRAAMFGAFGPRPDVVLSGVNRGLNTGRAVLHSGTVGAALTAANYGCRALALSAGVDGSDEAGDSWVPEEGLLHTAIGWLHRSPAATVLNVNLPPGPLVPGHRFPPARATTLAEAGTVHGRVSDPGGRSMSVVFEDSGGPAEPGTDVAALSDGYVSVTAIRSVVEDARFDLAGVLARAAGP